MKRFNRAFRLALSLALLQPFPLFALALDPVPSPKPALSTPDAALQKKIQQVCRNLPLAFERNEGQVDPQARFLARGQGYSLFVTPAEAVLTLGKNQSRHLKTGAFDKKDPRREKTASSRVRMRLVGGNRLCALEGQDRLTGKSNYFIGNDPDKWLTGLAQFGKVRMSGVYPGIDMVYYGKQSRMEYDFVVKPGADPRNIRLRFEGIEKAQIGPDGNLRIRTACGILSFQAPVIYQGEGNGRTRVKGNFLQTAKNEIGFAVGTYDPSQTLVIDPSLVYSTYLGGSADDFATAIAVDGGGNAYITGQTDANFTVSAGPYQAAFGGGGSDAFVTKLNVSGSVLIFSTYLGGNGADEGWSVAVNGAGNPYVTGQTTGNYPITGGVVQTVFNGGANPSAFVTELNPFGSALVYSTYLGGSGGSVGYGIAVDGAGNAYVTGEALANYPTTPGAYQTVFGGSLANGFVTKLNPNATSMTYSTYLGGVSNDAEIAIAVDGSGDAVVTGEVQANFPTTPGAFQTVYGGGGTNAVVVKLNAAGSAPIYATYLGGSGGDFGYDVVVDGAGNAYVVGYTTSPNFPTTAGAYQTTLSGSQDAFVSKLNPSGTLLSYSTYLGGNGTTSGQGIAVDPTGNIYVTGATTGNFPTTPGAIQAAYGGGNSDAFVSVINPAGGGAADLVASTYLGGGGNDIAHALALDSSQNVYIAGITSGAFPTTAGVVQPNYGGSNSNAFVAKLSMATPTNTPQPTNTAVPPCSAVFQIDKNKYSVSTDLTQLGILISLCAPGACSVKIYNTAGEKVRTLLDVSNQPIGQDALTWDGKNDKQAQVASGVYIIVFLEPLGTHYARILVLR